MHAFKDSMWRKIWKILQNCLELNKASLLLPPWSDALSLWSCMAPISTQWAEQSRAEQRTHLGGRAGPALRLAWGAGEWNSSMHWIIWILMLWIADASPCAWPNWPPRQQIPHAPRIGIGSCLVDLAKLLRRLRFFFCSPTSQAWAPGQKLLVHPCIPSHRTLVRSLERPFCQSMENHYS